MALPKIQFVGPIIRAAIAALQTNMPGQVAVFNAEPANTVDLDAPATYHFGGQDLLAAYPFPQIEVAAVTGDTGNWAIGRSEVDHNPRVNVAVWIDGADGGGDIPVLYEKAAGYVRCVIECLSPTGAFGAGVELAQEQAIAWRIDPVPFDPTSSTPAQGRDFQKWLGSGLVQFRLEDVEHFT
jgi:hypothetical protein